MRLGSIGTLTREFYLFFILFYQQVVRMRPVGLGEEREVFVLVGRGGSPPLKMRSIFKDSIAWFEHLLVK